MTLAYLPQNQRARITEISSGTAPGRHRLRPAVRWARLGGISLAPAAATRSHSPMIKLHWKVDNLDGDDLVYRLFFREENDAVWRPLGGPDPLTKTDFDWNTEGLPDGTYVVRVVASDERSEPRERVLDASLDSAPILVDNRKPEVAGLVAKYPFVSGRARDDQSPLTGLEYAVDGGDWQILAPADGICDDLVEAFTLKLPTLPPGPARRHRARLGQRRQRGRRVGDGAGEGQSERRPRRPRARRRRPAPRARGGADGGRPRAELLRDPLLPRDARGGHRRPGLGGRPATRRGRPARPQGHDRAHHPHPQRSHRRGRPALREDRRRRGGQPARGGRRARGPDGR